MNLKIATEKEQEHLMVQWNNTQADYPRTRCIHQLFEQMAQQKPNTIAVVCENQTLTYAELNQRSNQLAHYLQRLGVGPEVLVGLCVERSLEMVVGLLGILKAGGAYVPLEPTYPQERLSFMLEDAQVPVVVTQEKWVQELFESTTTSEQASKTLNFKRVCLDTNEKEISQQSQENPNSPVAAENLAYVIYTSGSTGKPKGVQITHRSVVNFLNSTSRAPGLKEQDILVAVTTISFDIAVLEIYLPLIVGAKLVLANRAVSHNPEQLTDLINQSGATIMQATPAGWRLLLDFGWQGNPELKILCGGEKLPRELADRLLEKGAELWNLYGPTETTVWSTAYRVESAEGFVPIGRAIANTQIYLLDEQMQPVSIGTAGELYIGGDGLARGYLNRPELTQEKFVPNPFSDQPNSRLYKTGDLARYRSEGNLEFIGRIDYQVKIRGHRVELGEIETVLSQHPGVSQAVALVRDEVGDRQQLVAYVVLESTSPEEENRQIVSQLRSFLSEELPDYMIPSAFVLLDALPLTPNGKIDRKSLPASSQSRPALEEPFVAPRTETEKKLADLWSNFLGIEPLGVNDSFFELGGHSLLTVQLNCLVSDTFDVFIPPSYIYDHSTVAQFAQAIELAGESEPEMAIGAMTVEQLQAEVYLDPSIQPPVGASEPLTEPNSILLTGATGFVGAFLLDELLRQTQAKIFCLIRSCQTPEEAQQKIQKNFENYLLKNENLRSRIIPVIGDLSQPRLGLTEEDFNQLASEIDTIYHSGAYVNLNGSYSYLRDTNVLGTQEILRLASQTKLKPVHYLSTFDVFESLGYINKVVQDPSTEIREQDSLDDCEMLYGGYGQSKWVAEKILNLARDRGIPTCIYRLGITVGDSKTGAGTIDQILWVILKGLVEEGSFPKIDMPFNVATVDYVSRAIVYLSKQKKSWGQIFHMVNSERITWKEFGQYICDCGYPLQFVDYLEWQAKTKDLIRTSPDVAPLFTILVEKVPETQINRLELGRLLGAINCENTRAALDSDIVCPSFNAQLIKVYIRYFIEQGFLSAP